MNELDFNFDFDMDNFDMDFSIEDQTENSFCKPKVMRPKRVIYEHAEEFANQIALEKDMHVYSIVSGNFVFGDLLEALIVDRDIKVKKLYVSTLSLSENNVDSLANIMMYGKCEELHLMVSSYFYSHERGNLIKYIYSELEGKSWPFYLSVAGTHMKLTLIETDDLKITMQGSANLRSSANIEQFSTIENAELFDFNRDYFDIIEESYRINKKEGERSNKLWHQVQKLKSPRKLGQEKQVVPNKEG